MARNIARTFAALSATNEAILYAKSPDELYRQVCDAALSSGDFLATAIFLLEPGTSMLRFAAGFGEEREFVVSTIKGAISALEAQTAKAALSVGN